MPDAKAVKILFSKYWSSAGWRSDRSVSAEDYAYAKRAGVMFDPVELSHDNAVERAVAAVSAIRRQDVARAFLASLTTRRLDLRSALGSYSIGRHLEPHPFSGPGACSVCGEYDSCEPIDQNVLNFERLKWGGVRHSSPVYIALDLELLGKLEIPLSTDGDAEALLQILGLAASLPKAARARDLEKAVGGLLKSNKSEREVLLQILGYASVLEAAGHPGFLNQFIPAHKRELPPASKIDWQYPFAWWRGADSYNRGALVQWFPNLVESAAQSRLGWTILDRPPADQTSRRRTNRRR